ncbi:hypothetical protein [Pseudoduganella sp. R-34]|uniref:hypothetical protein n=1 Tax=Pseudoduganella sp. R-34 TaxID=3404062 RepID=UPI003CEC9ABB
MNKQIVRLASVAPLCIALFGCGGGGGGGAATGTATVTHPGTDTGHGTTTEPTKPDSGGGTVTDPTKPDTGGGTVTDPTKPDTGGGTVTDPTKPDESKPGSGDQNLANGIWIGAAADGRASFALVANGTPSTPFFLSSAPAGGGAPGGYAEVTGTLREDLVTGYMNLNDGAVEAKLYAPEGASGAAQRGILRGRFNPQNSLTVELVGQAGEKQASYQFNYSATSDQAQQLDLLHGSYGTAGEGPVLTISGPAGATMAMVRATIGSCTFRGMIIPSSAGKNLFNINLHGEGAACPAQGDRSSLNGLAALVNLRPGDRAPSLIFGASYVTAGMISGQSFAMPLVGASGALVKQQ